jgi:hypothetical protein
MRVKFFIVTLAGALFLSGCAGIPSSSQVYFGEEIFEDTSTQFVRVIARPPSVDMNPEEIVRGFLDACADPSENYGIARQYLADESAGSWNPLTGIEIYETTSTDVSGSPAKLTLTAGKLGTISDSGRYQSSDPGALLSKSFKLEQNNSGQWRISELSNGILLSSGDVDRSFRSFPIYFFNSNMDGLITDTVLVPVSNSGAATSLVRSLLEGPSPYLLPVAASTFPVGTTLTYGSVPITNGIAQVDLSKEILGADEKTRRALSAQLVWTLSTLASVTSVQISVSGQPLALSSIGQLQSIEDWQSLSTLPSPELVTLNVIRNEQIISVAGRNENLKYVSPSPLVSASEDPSGTRIAAVTSDGKSLLIGNSGEEEIVVAAQGDQISRPSWASDGSVLFADFGQGVREILSDGSIRAVSVDTSTLGTSDQVKQVSIASDGVRIAAVLSNGTQDVVAVGAIFRTSNESRIIGLHRIERSISSVRDVIWSSPTSVAVIGSDDSNSDLMFNISLLDGKTNLASTPIGAQQLAVDGGGKLYISAVDGSSQLIYQQSFGSWTELTSGIGGFFTR